jgi:hypothetical protein
MSAISFYTNIQYGIKSFSLPAIAGEATNISEELTSAYVYEIDDSESFNVVSLSNNDLLKSFYNNFVNKASGLDSKSNFNLNLIDSVYQIDSVLSSLYVKTKFNNPSYGAKRTNDRAKVEITTSGVLNSTNLIPDFKLYTQGNQTLDKLILGNQSSETFQDDEQKAAPYTEVREYEGILLQNYGVRLEPYWKEVFPWFQLDDHEDLGSKIQYQFQNCKIYSFVVKNYDYSTSSFYYSTYLFIVLNTAKSKTQTQDFSNFTGAFSGSQTLQLNKAFYPFSVIQNNATVYAGNSYDENLSGVTFDYPLFYKNESGLLNEDDTMTGFVTGTMACDLGGNLIVSYTGGTGYETGTAFKIADSQLCGVSGRSVFVRVDDVLSTGVELYKDLPNISNAINIYAFNFSGIDYVTSNESLDNIVTSGSIANSTQFYSNLQLKTSKYYSYNYNDDLEEDGFTFSYNFRAAGDGESTDYILDVKPTVKQPTIFLEQDAANDDVLVKSDYATYLDYRFNDEAISTVSITDTSNGLGQETTISTTNKEGTLEATVRNYFYNFDSQTLEAFSAKSSIYLNKNITIPNFTFELRRGGSVATFYDADLTAITSITSTALGQGDIFNYFYYPPNTETGTYRIYLTYGGESLYIKLADDFEPVLVPSGSYYELTKAQFEQFINSTGNIDIKLLKNKQTQFTFPFVIKTAYADTPTVSTPTITQVDMRSYSTADLFFSFDYAYATEAVCEVFNEDSNLIYTQVIDLDFSSSSATKTGVLEGINVSFSVGVFLKVTVRSLAVTSGVESYNSANASSSPYQLPFRLSISRPSEIKFYSDSNLTTEITSITVNSTVYLKLVLYDLLQNEINTSQYANYIKTSSINPYFTLNNSSDPSADMQGVTFTRINNHSYSLFISINNSIDVNQLSIKAHYDPLF